MTDRSGLGVALLVVICRGITIIGWPVLAVVDAMYLVNDGDPYALPFHGFALSALVATTCVTLADWIVQRFRGLLSALEERTETSTTDAYARGYADALAVREGRRLTALDGGK